MASYVFYPQKSRVSIRFATQFMVALWCMLASTAFAQQQEPIEAEPIEPPPQEIVLPDPEAQSLPEPEISVEETEDESGTNQNNQSSSQKNDQDSTQNSAAESQPATVTTRSGRTVITLESTIVGDKEQPKVLSIVPWQRPEHKTMKTAPVSGRIESTFQPIEEDSLNRELNYYKKSKQ